MPIFKRSKCQMPEREWSDRNEISAPLTYSVSACGICVVFVCLSASTARILPTKVDSADCGGGSKHAAPWLPNHACILSHQCSFIHQRLQGHHGHYLIKVTKHYFAALNVGILLRAAPIFFLYVEKKTAVPCFTSWWCVENVRTYIEAAMLALRRAKVHNT
jgi:hypothetical protein